MEKILFICGSLNQTSMMHQISKQLNSRFECWFTAYYTDGILKYLAKKGFLDFCIIGGKFRQDTEDYFSAHKLKVDYRGELNKYNLILTCSDLIIQKNLKGKKVILVQEGMTDSKNIFYYTAKYLGFPRYLASTSTTGLSDAYDYFCVASESYKKLFVKNGCKPEKILVTGIPNFDDCQKYTKNNFLYKDFVLVCTSDTRETFKFENRRRFIEKTAKIAGNKQLIFKLHPNEKVDRAIKEIKKYAPGSLVFAEGNTNEMIANCDTLITRFSSVAYIGLALGKKVYSDFNLEQLKSLLPEQNRGTSAVNIARICKYHINGLVEQNYEYDKRCVIPIPEF
jgi:hypothetical protein